MEALLLGSAALAMDLPTLRQTMSCNRCWSRLQPQGDGLEDWEWKRRAASDEKAVQ